MAAGLVSSFAAAADVRSDKIARLVQQLGAESFVERERATRELTELGIVARDALLAASDDADAEVRARARAVLAIVSHSDFRQRLEAFTADFDGSHKQTLPGWERFSSLFGSAISARQFFVEMQKAEPELLEAYAATGQRAAPLLETRCQAIYERLQASTANEPGPSIGTTASLLWVGAADDMPINEQLGIQLYSIVSHQSFRKHLDNGPPAVVSMLRKLFAMWIAKDAVPTATPNHLIFAAFYGLKAEGLAVATKVLGNPAAPPHTRKFALLTLGRFGDKSHVETAEAFLKDNTPCDSAQQPGAGRQAEVQMRDVSLAVLVQLTGQQPRDYAPSSVSSTRPYFRVGALIFADPAKREAALDKWRKWRVEHPQL